MRAAFYNGSLLVLLLFLHGCVAAVVYGEGVGLQVAVATAFGLFLFSLVFTTPLALLLGLALWLSARRLPDRSVRGLAVALTSAYGATLAVSAYPASASVLITAVYLGGPMVYGAALSLPGKPVKLGVTCAAGALAALVVALGGWSFATVAA